MNKETSPTLDNAFFKIVKNRSRIYVETHILEEGDTIEDHIHPKATEWIILPEGKAKVLSEGEWEEIETSKGEFTTVTIEPKDEHGLIAESPGIYFVVRNKARLK